MGLVVRLFKVSVKLLYHQIELHLQWHLPAPGCLPTEALRLNVDLPPEGCATESL